MRSPWPMLIIYRSQAYTIIAVAFLTYTCFACGHISQEVGQEADVRTFTS